MTCLVVIAGGGTSGHVLPALAISEALIDQGVEESQIVYFGAVRGVETSIVPPTGLRHEFFDVVGFKREISWNALWNNLSFVPKMMRARRRSIRFVREHRPSVVVSVGGYASLPAVLAARRCGVPVVVVSYDRRPGRASQWAARRANRCAVAYPESTLARAEWTGAPVRRAIRDLDRPAGRDDARRRWNVPEESFLIGVVGGSLGSGVLNEAISTYAKSHSEDEHLAIRHVVGQRFYSEYASGVESRPNGLDYRVVAYEDDMTTMYSAIDLLIARGGAGTVAEVATVGVPAILVPWQGAADDHQRANVRWLSDAGAAVLLDENEVSSQLAPTIEALRHDPAARQTLEQRARAMGERNRSNRIAQLVLEVCIGADST